MTIQDDPQTALIDEARKFASAAPLGKSVWREFDKAILLIRRMSDALESTVREMHARELHHFETEQAITEALRIDTHYMHPDARRVLSNAVGEEVTDG